MKYWLRVRWSDDAEWSEPEQFATRRERDDSAALNRVIGGIRTHSWDEPERKPTVRRSKGEK